MLPIPFEKAIPKVYRDTGGEALTALTAKADSHLTQWRDDLIELAYVYVPERAPARFLKVFGNMMNAGLLASDSEAEKRRKIAGAVAGHKNRGTWDFDVKLKIDAIAGGDAKLFGNLSEAWWVLADGTEPSAYDWSAFGFDSEQGFDGIILAGEGDEGIFPGNVRIDVDNSGLTTAEVENMKLSILDSVPVYFRVILGYISGGQFTEYANGRIE